MGDGQGRPLRPALQSEAPRCDLPVLRERGQDGAWHYLSLDPKQTRQGLHDARRPGADDTRGLLPSP